MLTRPADVRTNQTSREVPTAAWPTLHPRGSKAWRRKVALVWRYHSIWHHSKGRMEQHLAGSDAGNHGLERGDSCYFVWRCNWCALGGMDRFVRLHTTKSLIDYAQNRLPGEMISLDPGDSNVYSVFRNSRYTVSFVDVASFVSPFISKIIQRRFFSRRLNTQSASSSTSAVIPCVK